MRTDTWTFRVDRMLPYHIPTGQLNVVESFSWTINSTDGTYNASVSGAIAFDINNLDVENFITIQQVNDDLLKQWVLDTYSEERMNGLYSNLDYQLELQNASNNQE